ncbi:GNAT family N-acetyltransferase [Corynebacterium diphtheriae]|uniref:GNAT family N-acetyltransferase n=1 Tax=Corynebacterium diphtheriae TaxID=1717 RepID=UPI000A1FB9C8|nr:GNAT family N-acetyltransferase [Corynebacterium diphtheriae]OSQ26325.1 GNAT family N-acetyltransferase [Corynebacterium diphtheriae]OWN69996.1 acetyltransferase [Corynebacterium diphtheriae bv. gravis]OWO23564.1 acetyltransferase [Corynebacterium diphtheriae bv. gravis]OWO49792.1 acetyltransferase [Corynebacterium diphtheriae bv. gravis]UEB76723.1 GNAT family N-acetyltransferase [Corynebacterium diphtheriae]
MHITVSPLRDLHALEVHALYKLRVDIFVHEQQCPYAEIDTTDALDTTQHILAWDDNGDLLGCARVFSGDHGTHIGRFAVIPQARKTGTAHEILTRAIELGGNYLEAQSPLVGYYARYGFTPCGAEFLDESIPHTPMSR